MIRKPNQDSEMAKIDATTFTPSLVGGLFSGFYIDIFMFAYASIIFTGELEPFLPRGIAALLFGVIAVVLILAVTSAMSGLENSAYSTLNTSSQRSRQFRTKSHKPAQIILESML